MFFYDPSNRDPKELLPGIVARTFWEKNMLAAVVDLDPHTELPLHSHPHEQLGIVLEGEIEFTVHLETKVLKPYEIYVIPGDVPHAAKTFDHPVKVMDIFSPVREEYKY
jgi:quercetin dioxygenase-like cupin family protein